MKIENHYWVYSNARYKIEFSTLKKAVDYVFSKDSDKEAEWEIDYVTGEVPGYTNHSMIAGIYFGVGAK